MERRDFLQSIASAIALALTPAFGTGCATVHGPSLDALAVDDGAALVDALTARLAQIRDSANLPRVRAWAVARGLDADFGGNLFGAMWSAATFRDLPAKARGLPEVQAWVRAELPNIASAVFSTAELLDNLDRAARDELARVLVDEPDVLDTAFSGFAGHAERRGVEAERVAQIRSVTDHHVWRIRHQSIDALFDDYTSRLDRLCRRNGVERANWRAGLAAEIPEWMALGVASDPGDVDLDNDDVIADLSHDGSHLGVFLEQTGKGLEIRHVTAGSPADAAGLRVGDRVVAVDGSERDAIALVAWLRTQVDGRSVRVDVERDGTPMGVDVALGVGAGDHIVAERTATRGRFGYLSAASEGVGVKIITYGATIFAAGAVIGLLGIGAQSSGLAGFGAVLTILGAAMVIVGLIVLIIEVIIGQAREGRHRDHARAAPTP